MNRFVWQKGDLVKERRTLKEWILEEYKDKFEKGSYMNPREEPHEGSGDLAGKHRPWHGPSAPQWRMCSLKKSIPLHEHLKAEADEHRKTFTPGHHTAVNGYTGFDYADVNEHLRKNKGHDPNSARDFVNDSIKHMDHATHHKTTKDMTVWRGFKHEQARELEPGTHHKDHGYISTSINSHIAERFGGHLTGTKHIAKIHVPAGTKGHYVGREPAGENEFILHRGTTFKVHHHSYDSEKKIHTVHMSVHSQDEQ